jgi:hypothetical protein
MISMSRIGSSVTVTGGPADSALPAGFRVVLGAEEELTAGVSAELFHAVVAATEPSAELRRLLGRRSSRTGDLIEIEFFDAGNTVNGVPWIWLEGTERWWLVPGDLPMRGREVVRAFATMAGNMGGVIAEVRCWHTPEAAVVRLDDDTDGLMWLFVEYGMDPSTAAAAALDASYASGVYWSDGPWCPCCDETGWECSIRTATSVEPDLMQYGWNLLWRPCEEHAEGCEFMNDRSFMSWDGTRWIVDPPPEVLVAADIDAEERGAAIVSLFEDSPAPDEAPDETPPTEVSQVRGCVSTAAGHGTSWAAWRGHTQTPRDPVTVELEQDGWFRVIDTDGRARRLWNHDAEQLAEAFGVDGSAAVVRGTRIVTAPRPGGAWIHGADGPTPCSYEWV